MSIVNIIEDNTLPAWKKRIQPNSEWNGECVTAGVKVDVYQATNYIATLKIPIHGYLDRSMNQAIEGWNGNSIQLKESCGYLYTPQIGAGKKESDESFTGMVMGKAKEGNVEKTGLLGYSHGEQSLFLDSESGGAIFGRGSGEGQISIDPKANKSLLFSKNYWKNYDSKGFPISYEETNKNHNGLLIDLTAPKIEYGNQRFIVDSQGNLTCGEQITGNGILMQVQTFVDSSIMGYYLIETGHTIYPETGPGVGSGEVDWPAPHSDGFKYRRMPVLASIFIPDGFNITQAICKVIEGGIVDESPDSTYQYIGGAGGWVQGLDINDGWSPELNPPVSPYQYHTEGYYQHYAWDVLSQDSIRKYSIDYCCGNIIDDFALYYFPDEIVHYDIDGYITSVMGMQDAYFNVFVEDDSPLATQISETQTGFTPVRNYKIDQEDIVVESHERVIDFTEGAKTYLHSGTNIIGLMLTSVPDSVDIRPYIKDRRYYPDFGYSMTKYYSTICTSPYAVEANTRNGYVSLSIIIYGHYNPTQ